jgi:hypothetical protein
LATELRLSAESEDAHRKIRGRDPHREFFEARIFHCDSQLRDFKSKISDFRSEKLLMRRIKHSIERAALEPFRYVIRES